jgi:AcrR family transcriptional regulator
MSGLRERKKARTRAEIQNQALRLFRDQGYDATTIEQIAEAAQVSESTFFRYFPAKEDVILWDELDPRLLAVFRAQPATLGPVAALRATLRELIAEISADQWAKQRERITLLLDVPALRVTLLDSLFRDPMRLLGEGIAERTGVDQEDPSVRALAGSVMGVCVTAMLAWVQDPDTDVLTLVDEVLAQVEAGLPLR